MIPCVRIGIAASMLGVCTRTIRRWDAAGKIACTRTLGGHRRVSLATIESRTNRDDGFDRELSPAGAAVYCRVSSHEQKAKGDLDRQVATRIVAACRHHGVEVLRFEDLSWSSHSAKRVSGAWLASWQVHWFFSQVQERATTLARLAGIAVELVGARGTSKRCSACGTTGIREGKTFSCTNKTCNKQMDSDLNGSRNVRIAPTSPRLHAKGEGARYRPLACHG